MSEITDLSYSKTALLATVGSTLEVFLQHPLVVIKNSIQCDREISFNPTKLYKGIFINAGSMSVITAVQFSGYSFFYNNLNTCSLSSALLAGACSSVIASPFELAVVQRNKHFHSNSSSLFKMLYNNHGTKFLSKGLLSCCMRESIFTTGLLSFGPFIESKLDNTTHKSLYASTISGIVSGVASHPFDTIKANQQFKLYDTINYQKLLTVRNLYKGLLLRTVRITAAFFIINETNKHLCKFL